MSGKPRQSERMRTMNRVLDTLSRTPLSLPTDNSDEATGDYRIAAERDYQARIERLRRALNEGADKYQIAYLAISVGFGTALPAVQRARLRRQADVKRGESKAGYT